MRGAGSCAWGLGAGLSAVRCVDARPGQLAAAGRVILTELQGPWAKRSRSEVYLSTMFWESLAADNVFMFGHGGVRCLNSPLTLRNFTSQFDLIASNDGGFVSVRARDLRSGGADRQ